MKKKHFKWLSIVLSLIFITVGSSFGGYKFYEHSVVKKLEKVVKKDKIEVASDLIKKYEGFSEKIYICPAGSKTIGYGYSKSLKSFDKSVIIEKRDAEILLENEIFAIMFKLKYSMFPRTYQNFTNNQKSALSSLIYNIGETNFTKSNLYKKLQKYFVGNKKNYNVAKDVKKEWLSFHHYRNQKGKVVKSVCDDDELCLENRRKEEINLFFNNI